MSRFISIRSVVAMGALAGALWGGAGTPAAVGGVAISGSTTTITGTGQATHELEFARGVYAVTWSTPGTVMSVSVSDAADDVVTVFGLGGPKGSELFAVDGETVKPGKLKMEAGSMEAWTVTIVKLGTAGAGALPQTLSGAVLESAISKAFKAGAGPLKVAYAYKSEPKGTGTLRICDVATGKNMPVDHVMFAGNASGEFEVNVPAAGVYVACATFPLGSNGGEVSLKQ